VKALLETVRQLEEERGEALLRVAALEASLRVAALEASLRVAALEGQIPTVTELAPIVPGDRALARALADVMPRHARRGVSCRVLTVLLALTEGPLAVNDLRDVLGTPQATTSEWLTEAVGVGLVVVEVDGFDKRRHTAKLTPKGHVYMRDRRRSPTTA
jgi:DNA-binding MarR family transcriptional regulator